MGKKNKKKQQVSIENLISDEALRSLSKKEVASLREHLDKLSKEVRIGCSHTKKNGEHTLTVIDPNNQIVECEKCGTRFSLRLVTAKELKMLKNVSNDIVNQIKLLTDGDKADHKAINDLGAIAENINGVTTLYERTLIDSGKKHNKGKKHKNSGNNYGGYGYGAIKFKN